LVDEKQFRHVETIIDSMTVKERSITNCNHRKRIALRVGVQISEINNPLKQHAQMSKSMDSDSG